MNRDILYTDGAQYVAEAGVAYLLLDEIALANRYERRAKAEEFQMWTLTRNSTGNGATLDCGDGNGNTVYSKRIEFTDFPLEAVMFFCEDGTILLPSEHLKARSQRTSPVLVAGLFLTQGRGQEP